jgi:hypothetical protein
MNTETVKGWGVDAAREHRPGVPWERPPRPAPGAHIDPAPQRPRTRVLHRREIDRLTTVFGSAQPPKGLSGMLRRLAYRLPEHRARHWMLLLVADRVDELEHRLANPSGFFVAGLAAVTAAWVAAKVRKSGLVPSRRAVSLRQPRPA